MRNLVIGIHLVSIRIYEARIFPFGLPCEKGIWQRSYLYYEEALEMKHKFVLRLIDEKFYGFGDEKTRHVDML